MDFVIFSKFVDFRRNYDRERSGKRQLSYNFEKNYATHNFKRLLLEFGFKLFLVPKSSLAKVNRVSLSFGQHLHPIAQEVNMKTCSHRGL